MSYEDRLNHTLSLNTLRNRRLRSDLVIVYNTLHGGLSNDAGVIRI